MSAITPQPPLPLRRVACACCGAAFDCGGGTDHCWCMDESYRLPMPAATSEDCLCPACLRAAAASAGRPV